jgi:hypothetical protein
MYFINYYQEVLSSPLKRVILQYYTYNNVSTLLTLYIYHSQQATFVIRDLVDPA